MVITLTATCDKTTKTKKRFIINDNENDISGTIYLDKDTETDEIKLKVKLE